MATSANNRSWMYNPGNVLPDGSQNPTFIQGVNSFIEFAKAHPRYMDGLKIKCPCRKICKNRKYLPEREVSLHLQKYGFVAGYTCWRYHGEPYVRPDLMPESSVDRNSVATHLNQPTHRVDHVHHVGLDERDMLRDMLHDVFPNLENNDSVEAPNEDVRKFYDILQSLDVPLYEGSSVSKLVTVARLLNGKVDSNMTQNALNIMMSIIKEILPQDNTLDKDYLETMKTLEPLSLGIKYIDACRNDCMLFYKDGDENLSSCKVCGLERYKRKRKRGSSTQSKMTKPAAYKVLKYLSLKPRLQRLYTLPETAKAMTRHKDCPRKEGIMSHPSDGEAWKHFDTLHPAFAVEPRNVRLCLSADGFNPFRGQNRTYSMWPVIVTPLNLPPWLCMKDEFMFLSLLIPGDKSPGNSIDVYLQPLIDELNDLWKDGCTTYDASRKQNFQLKAALLWTVSDFPAYGMLSGWSTHGKLACPICMGQTKGIRLAKGGKTCFFDCHRQFLPEEHVFRKDKVKFTKGKLVLDEPPRHLSGEEVRAEVEKLSANRFGKDYAKQRPPGFGVNHNWTKKSVFWELPYWSDLLVRHMLDVMHIEKKLFENIFNTIMDVKGKTKDNLNSRADLALLCNRRSLELKEVRGKFVKPAAQYTLTKEKKIALLKWVEELKLPDGYSSNLRSCVEIKHCKMSGMKSHDCHVFLTRLLPIALRELLPSNIWDPITEICEFFRCLCASSLSVEHMKALEESIVVTLCKLEKIFPPSLFDSMEHLPIHLAYEAKVGGPVQYRWMYPFERFLNRLKRKVKNNSLVESCVTEAVLAEEVATFCAHYLSSDVRSRLNKDVRNDDNEDTTNDQSLEKISVFIQPGRFLGKKPYKTRFLSSDERKAIGLYVIMNCSELEKYIRLYEGELHERYPNLPPNEISNKTDTEIREWLVEYAEQHPDDEELHKCRHLLMQPNRPVNLYKGYFVNAYAFRASEFDDGRVTCHSGVTIRGSDDYYGVLREVIGVSYPGHRNNVVLFKCDWRNSVTGVRKHSRYDLVDVDMKSLHQGQDMFILAAQADQVYFSPYPRIKKSITNRSEWYAVWKTKARRNIEIHYNDTPLTPTTISSLDRCLQEDDMPTPPTIVADIEDDVLLAREGVFDDVDIAELQKARGSRNTSTNNRVDTESESASESEESSDENSDSDSEEENNEEEDWDV